MTGRGLHRVPRGEGSATGAPRRWAATLAAALVVGACGDGGDAGVPVDDAAISGVAVVATTGPDQSPVDAVPSPDGTVMYFVATGDPAGTVYRVPATGGAPATVFSGAPLTKPSGISVTTDGSRLLVADPEAGGAGAVLAVPLGSAVTAAVVPGTQGRAPRGLDVVGGGGGDVVYFTGTGPQGARPGLFRVPAAGGEVVTVAEGPPFRAPDAVVVAGDGTAYVSDQGEGPGKGLVLRVRGRKVEPVLSGLTLGSPAGVTLVENDSVLLVSSIAPRSRSNQVLLLDLRTGRTAAVRKVIGESRDTSGGLHRAHAAPVLGWAGVQRSGRVYRVDP